MDWYSPHRINGSRAGVFREAAARGGRGIGRRFARIERGAFRLHLFKRPTGRESYTIRRTGRETVLEASSANTDRGVRQPLEANLRLRDDGMTWGRGIVVGLGVFLVTGWFAPLSIPHPLWALAFALIGSAILGILGLLAGIWADKFDQLAAFQNFLIMPLTFLSGVFYSIRSLPPFWQALSHFNPFFYMIDGFRYGFFGLSDIAPTLLDILHLTKPAAMTGHSLISSSTGRQAAD